MQVSLDIYDVYYHINMHTSVHTCPAATPVHSVWWQRPCMWRGRCWCRSGHYHRTLWGVSLPSAQVSPPGYSWSYTSPTDWPCDLEASGRPLPERAKEKERKIPWEKYKSMSILKHASKYRAEKQREKSRNKQGKEWDLGSASTLQQETLQSAFNQSNPPPPFLRHAGKSAVLH